MSKPQAVRFRSGTRFYTIEEVARILRVRPKTIYRLLKYDPPALRHIWVGGSIRIPEPALEQFVERGGVPSAKRRAPTGSSI